MKNLIKYILQKALGFNNYLFVFSLYIIKTLKWNKNENDFIYFLNLIKEDGIILDVGANIGVMTTYFAKNKPNSLIYSFEPITSNIKALKRIVDYYRFDNVKIIEKAIGNSDGQIEMIMPVVKSVKMQGLSHVIDTTDNENEKGVLFKTDITRLDTYFSKNLPLKNIIAIKIDVENYEYFVLEGAKELLAKFRPIIYCELWENKNREECFNLISKLNYSIKIIENGNLVNFIDEYHKTQNFFFIPK